MGAEGKQRTTLPGNGEEDRAGSPGQAEPRSARPPLPATARRHWRCAAGQRRPRTPSGEGRGGTSAATCRGSPWGGVGRRQPEGGGARSAGWGRRGGSPAVRGVGER